MGKEKADIKILIVDDNAKDLKLLELRLLELGFRNIVQATNGMEALELAQIHLPDLILLDIIMPGMNGGEIKQQLSDDQNTKDTPTVFITSIIRKDEEKSLGHAGKHILLAKPYSPDELLKAINKILKIST